MANLPAPPQERGETPPIDSSKAVLVQTKVVGRVPC
jgi:hypothetical protein